MRLATRRIRRSFMDRYDIKVIEFLGAFLGCDSPLRCDGLFSSTAR